MQPLLFRCTISVGGISGPARIWVAIHGPISHVAVWLNAGSSCGLYGELLSTACH
jgi:hypothetical protein